MKPWLMIVVVMLIGGGLVAWRWYRPTPVATNISNQTLSHTMQITSSAFTDGKAIPSEFTCDGRQVSPPLQFTGIPSAAKSLVLIMEDPDVPRSIRPDGLFVHWMVWNVPTTTTALAAGAVPPGVSGKNSGGNIGYTSPCPPSGEHRYYFRLYALDTDLVLPSNATKADLLRAMQNHLLDQAELMGRYGRA